MKSKIDGYAHPVHGLIESPEMAAARKEQIGKNPLNKDRRAVTEDYINPNPDNRVVGDRLYKDDFTDDDVREITVAEIDEKMLDLVDGDQNNPATTKAYNDLRDLRQAIIDLSRPSDLSFYGAALERVAALQAEGKLDEAEVVQGAAELLHDTSQRAFGTVDYAKDNYQQQRVTLVKDSIDRHNALVVRNKARTQ